MQISYLWSWISFSSQHCCCCSDPQSCLTLCDPKDCSKPGFPILYHLPKLAQTHVHWVSDAIQPFHPLSSPSSPAFNLSPALGSFLMSRLFPSGGQSIGPSALASVFPMNIQDWFPLEFTGLISLQAKGLSRVFSNTTVQKHQFFRCSVFFMVQLSHPYMITGKTIWTFISKVLSLLFNTLSRFVIAFLPRSEHLLISWLQSPSAVILEPKKIVCHCFHCFPIYLPWSDCLNMILAKCLVKFPSPISIWEVLGRSNLILRGVYLSKTNWLPQCLTCWSQLTLALVNSIVFIHFQLWWFGISHNWEHLCHGNQ